MQGMKQLRHAGDRSDTGFGILPEAPVDRRDRRLDLVATQPEQPGANFTIRNAGEPAQIVVRGDLPAAAVDFRLPGAVINRLGLHQRAIHIEDHGIDVVSVHSSSSTVPIHDCYWRPLVPALMLRARHHSGFIQPCGRRREPRPCNERAGAEAHVKDEKVATASGIGLREMRLSGFRHERHAQTGIRHKHRAIIEREMEQVERL